MNIPIMQVYKESFRNVGTHKLEWLKVAFGPFLIWALGVLLLGIAYGHSGFKFELNEGTGIELKYDKNSPFLAFAQYFYSITSFIALYTIYINGYRYATLREGKDRWVTLNINMRFVKMIIYGILIALLAGLYLTISGGIILGQHIYFESTGLTAFIGSILSFIGFYIFFRIILYPLLISIDHGEPLRESWRLMKGNVLRFITLAILVVLTVMLIFILGTALIGLITYLLSYVGSMFTIVGAALGVFFSILMFLLSWAINTKVMALVYQALTNNIRNPHFVEN